MPFKLKEHFSACDIYTKSLDHLNFDKIIIMAELMFLEMIMVKQFPARLL